MKKAILSLVLLWGAVTMHAATGTSCADAIPLGKDYTEQIATAKTVWYTASTYDLPVKVCFTPINPALPAPEVEMDFTCTPGVYEDSILCSLFCKSSASGVSFDMPHKPVLQLEDGAYCISMGKRYRDLLLQAGISYNVQVFVKVTFNSAGTLTMVPDSEFSDCMDGGTFTQLGDTINVLAQDKNRHVILPYIQWVEDSVRYIWNGTKPAHIAIASTCEFDPTDWTDGNIVDRFDIQPGETIQYSADQIKYYAEFENVQAGMYYGKFYSDAAGVLTIERVPVAPPDGGATLLRYDKPVTIMANDTNALYALRRDTVALRFDTPTDHVMRMYIGATADFTPTTALASYQYIVTSDGHALMITASELETLWASATGNYLYVRFDTGARTSVTPSVWQPSDCALKWKELEPGTMNVTRSGAGRVYHKLVYSKWQGGDITFQWGHTSATCPLFIGETCTFAPNTNDTLVFYNNSIRRRGTLIIPATTVEEWAPHVDEEGNIYVLFNPTVASTMTITSDAPEEQDPTYPATTISISCIDGTDKNIQVSVSQAQQITVTDTTGAVVKTWSAVAGVPHAFHLAPGAYILKGETEQIELTI